MLNHICLNNFFVQPLIAWSFLCVHQSCTPSDIQEVFYLIICILIVFLSKSRLINLFLHYRCIL